MPRTETRVLTPVGVLSALLVAAVLALGSAVSDDGAAVALLAGGAVLSIGWPQLCALAGRRGVQLVLLGTTVVVVVASVVTGEDRGVPWLPVVLASALLASFLHQLLRRDGRRRLVVTLAGTCLGVALLGSAACYLAAMDERMGQALVTVAVLACGFGAAADLVLHRTGPAAEWTLPASMLVGAVLGLLLAVLLDVRWSAMVLTGVAAPVLAHAVRRLLGLSSTARDALAQGALGAASVLCAGVVAYGVAWLFR